MTKKEMKTPYGSWEINGKIYPLTKDGFPNLTYIPKKDRKSVSRNIQNFKFQMGLEICQKLQEDPVIRQIQLKKDRKKKYKKLSLFHK